MSIVSVEPKTSRVSGGVEVHVNGDSFLADAISLVPTLSNGVTTVVGHAEISEDENGIIFSVAEQDNSFAKYRLNNVFPKAFKIKAKISDLPQSFPSVNKTKVFQIAAVSASDSLLKTFFFIEYTEDDGYLAVIERLEYNQITSREQIKINPKNITSLILEVGSYHHSGYLEVVEDDQKIYNVFVGKTDRILSVNQNTNYLIEFTSQTPNTGVALNSRIKLNKIETIPFVLFAGYPGIILESTDSTIIFKTSPGTVSTAKEKLIYSNGISVFEYDFVAYTDAQKVENLVKHFDCLQSVYGNYSKIKRNNLKKQSSPFVWDNDYFIQEEMANYNVALPSLWDPSTGQLPSNMFQSGIDFGKTAELLDIQKFYSQEKESWHAKIMHGTYYTNNVPYFLYSSESIMETLPQELLNNKSFINLKFMPKKEIPISIFALGKNKSKEQMVYKKSFKEVQKFSGKIIDGVELDSTIEDNIDTTKNEFIVIRNLKNKIINFKIPSTKNKGQIYSFNLPEDTMAEFPPSFSRKDIFINETSNLLNPGDYFVAYGTKSVSVKLPNFVQNDFGNVTYDFAYPATIYFNKNCIVNNSSGIVAPTAKNLPNLQYLGTSNGASRQKLFLESSPIIDLSTEVVLDQNSLRLFLYDEYTNGIDSSWLRVKNLQSYGPEDSVYELNSLTGVITFGNGVNGKIPPRFAKFYAAYKESLIVQYEPEGCLPYWVPKNKDLNLTKQNLTSGFLFIDRQEKVPTKLVANFGVEKIGSFETTNLYATLYGVDSQVISDTEVYFEILNGAGELSETKLITNSNGQVSTVYNPSNKFEDLAVKVNLFEEGSNKEIHGLENFNAYGIRGGKKYSLLNMPEILEGEVENTLIFKIIDDKDPFLLYDNQKRTGGKFILLYKEIGGIKTPVVPEYISEFSIGFAEPLPQPFDENAPNYEPDLRGFFIVNKKTIQTRAYVKLSNDDKLYSNIASTKLELSALQKGLWTLPIFPSHYNGSQINRATYIQPNG